MIGEIAPVPSTSSPPDDVTAILTTAEDAGSLAEDAERLGVVIALEALYAR